MNILKNILAVIFGYSTFAVSAVMLFKLANIDPHADPSVGVVSLTLSYGFIFSFIGGLFAQLISKTKQLRINFVLASLIAGFAAFSLFKSGGNHYSQLAAIFLFAPASILGGFIYLKRVSRDK